jgi:beta-1,2-mannobiose phosphorylase / 1,2-beta-oligomannan phosphorylase
MKKTFLLLYVALFAVITAANCQEKDNKDSSGGWIKYENNPVLGGDIGTIFDVCVLKNKDGVYQMYSSWYDGFGIGLSESNDGIKWAEPIVSLVYTGFKNHNGNDKGNDFHSWDKYINRPVVIIKDGMYHMWFSGQDSLNSAIGYAVSNDGKNWKKQEKPVLSPGAPWEKTAVMSPHVIWDDQEHLFKMWYSGGDPSEPDAIGYATSKDGMNWIKNKNNPVFSANKQNKWERAKVAGCQVIKRKHDYLMFYIGYSDPDHPQIGMARSKDGIAQWERYTGNPVIQPGSSGWDSYAVYKPYAVPDPDHNRWLLYYNGCRGWDEQIGMAIHKEMDLGF